MLLQLFQLLSVEDIVDDECAEVFREMIEAKDTNVILAALDCLQCLVKEFVKDCDRDVLYVLQSKLLKLIKKLKDSETYSVSIQFKACRLIREMEKVLVLE